MIRDEKRVSVVVGTYNRPKDVIDTVTSLVSQSVKPFEIIIIDDGSTPPLNLRFSKKN